MYLIPGTKRMLVWLYATFEHLPEVRAKQPRYLTNHVLEARALLAALRAGRPVAFDALDDAGRAIVRHAYRARGAERVDG